MLSRSPAESNSTYVVDSLDKYLEKYVEAYFILKTYKEKYDQEPEIYREGILVGPCFCRKWPGGVPPTRKPLDEIAVFDLADQYIYEGGKNYGILAFARAIESAHNIKEQSHEHTHD
jgi:hypothetical protein